jgi:hypothetical protein
MGRYLHHWFWRDSSDQSKGGLWAYLHSDHVKNFGIGTAAYSASGPPPENGKFYFTASKNSRSKGKKWRFTMEDGSKFTCRTHSGASFVAVKAWAKTWNTIPVQIEEVKKTRPRDSESSSHQWDERHKVYFVKLLAFDVTATGKLYYKIGKAKIVPRRIRQFGPCTIEAVLDFEHQREAYEAEAMLHKLFDHHRVHSTEIFTLNDLEAQEIRNAFSRMRAGIEPTVKYHIRHA